MTSGWLYCALIEDAEVGKMITAESQAKFRAALDRLTECGVALGGAVQDLAALVDAADLDSPHQGSDGTVDVYVDMRNLALEAMESLGAAFEPVVGVVAKARLLDFDFANWLGEPAPDPADGPDADDFYDVRHVFQDGLRRMLEFLRRDPECAYRREPVIPKEAEADRNRYFACLIAADRELVDHPSRLLADRAEFGFSSVVAQVASNRIEHRSTPGRDLVGSMFAASREDYACQLDALTRNYRVYEALLRERAMARFMAADPNAETSTVLPFRGSLATP
ncbi:hypothetical protein [Crossiella sp. NPDC003009]